MRRVILNVVILTVLLSNLSCLPYFGRKTVVIEISDVTQRIEKEIAIQIPENRIVYKRKAYVTGKVDKKVRLNLVEIGPGKIDTVIYKGDHYGTKDYVKYEPLQATEGQLRLEVTFYY